MSLIKQTILACVLSMPFLISCEKQENPANRFIKEAKQIAKSIPLPSIPDHTIDLIDFSGQQPDESGSYDFRHDIQKAINTLTEKGGGILRFRHTQGNSWVKQIETYRVKGPIHLKSNIELAFTPNLRIYFEFDPESYMLPGGTLRRYEGTTMFSFSPLIYAFNERNISLVQESGSGVPARIDGDGMRWQRWAVEQDGKRTSEGLKRSYEDIRDWNINDTPLKDRIFTDVEKDVFRPQMIHFFMCQDVLIDGIQLENSPFWMVHPVFSENMTFRNMIFDGPVVNNDGFDPESSDKILIENIIFNNHDDNVAIKAGRDKEGRDGVTIEGTLLESLENRYIQNGRLGGPTTNVVVRNCTFRGHHSIAIGSEMSGGVKGVYVYDNVGPQQVKNALYLKSSRRRGGTIEDVFMVNNTFNRVESIATLLPNYDGDTQSPFVPTFKNVWLVNTHAKTSNHGVRIKGWPESPISNVHLINVSIREVEKEEIFDLENVIDLSLSNVIMEGERSDGLIQKMDSTALPERHR